MCQNLRQTKSNNNSQKQFTSVQHLKVKKRIISFKLHKIKHEETHFVSSHTSYFLFLNYGTLIDKYKALHKKR